ncbi:speedy protein E4-like [Desmodus rotundus]|uniref:speedy protein E4-like n=1 Tax=Desmodus rotundus TaxID=9430 RepID=UPI00238162C4|nr:speedy protein E4-like [Desmodus rotundus]
MGHTSSCSLALPITGDSWDSLALEAVEEPGAVCLVPETWSNSESPQLHLRDTYFLKEKSLKEIMAGCEQSLQSDNLSPQPSTSGYPLEVTVIQVNPGPSAPCVDSGPLRPNTISRKRKRGQSTEEEGEEETAPRPKNIGVIETVCGQKVTLKKKRTSTVLPEHHEAFARLLKDPVVKGFLEWDRSLRLTDKYLLAMVIAYFSRAGLFCWQYQRLHFFLALYLALDMEEDYHAPKEAIFSFLYGDSNCARRPLFHKLRFQFFRSMGYRAWVTKEECKEIQAFDPELWVWRRDRGLLSDITEPEVAKPSGESSSQQEVNPGANDRPEEAKEEPPVQII